MLLLKDCIKNLKAFKAGFGKQYGITKLGIFGSVARQENREDSDIDIVVEVNHPSLRLMYELEEALKDLFGCKVDLIRFRDTLRPLFKSNLQKDVIYVCGPVPLLHSPRSTPSLVRTYRSSQA